MTKRRTALLSMLQQGISHLHASSGQLGTCHSQAGKLEQALIAAAAKAAPQQQSKLKVSSIWQFVGIYLVCLICCLSIRCLRCAALQGSKKNMVDCRTETAGNAQ